MIVERTWGTYEVLCEGHGWKLKRLIVNPNSKSSLQRHFKRGEFWFYVKTKMIQFIPLNQWHQLFNDTNEPLEIIELQFGEECIEEDIERK